MRSWRLSQPSREAPLHLATKKTALPFGSAVLEKGSRSLLDHVLEVLERTDLHDVTCRLGCYFHHLTGLEWIRASGRFRRRLTLNNDLTKARDGECTRTTLTNTCLLYTSDAADE